MSRKRHEQGRTKINLNEEFGRTTKTLVEGFVGNPITIGH